MVLTHSETPNILLYRTPTCPWCHKAADWLTAHKIAFKSIDVSTDHKALEEMIKKSSQMGVPVIDIDGKIIVGFDEPQLKKLLKVK